MVNCRLCNCPLDGSHYRISHWAGFGRGDQYRSGTDLICPDCWGKVQEHLFVITDNEVTCPQCRSKNISFNLAEGKALKDTMIFHCLCNWCMYPFNITYRKTK